MSLPVLRSRIPAINSVLICALFFVIPTHVAPAYFLTLLLLLLLLLEGEPLARVRELAHSPLPAIFVAYWLVFPLSLLWTQDMDWGQRMVRKHTFFLLFPLYLLAARREHFRFYLAAFLASVAMCVVLAWYNWVRLHHLSGLPAGIQVDKGIGDTAPFVDRIMYTPILAFAAYLLLHEWFFGPRLPRLRRRWLLAAFLLAVVGNVLMSGGRSGVIGLLALIGVAIIQRFAQRPALAVSVAAAAVTLVVGAGYAIFPLFQERMDKAVQQLSAEQGLVDHSISYRMAYAKGALRVFADQPIAGTGVGDLPDEYLRINPGAPLESGRMWNPHNHYLLVLSTTGLLGGFMLVLVLASVASVRTDPNDQLRRIQVALVVLFVVICFGESYLARSNTTLMFVLFSALVARSALNMRLGSAAVSPERTASR